MSSSLSTPAPLADTRKRCFDPVVDAQTRLLILGSLPGEKSLAHSQYYAHPQNKFWRLLGEILGVELTGLPYDARLASVLAHGVGLWDVVAQASRYQIINLPSSSPAYTRPYVDKLAQWRVLRQALAR